MNGVQFVVDDQGRKTAVMIDLKSNPKLWEDFYDRVLVEEREQEPRESLGSVKARLRRKRSRNRDA